MWPLLAAPRIQISELLWSPWLLGGLIGLFCIALLMRRWIKSFYRDDDGPTESRLELMSQINDMHRQGEISDEEYRNIKSRLATAAQRSLVGKPSSRSGNFPSVKNAGSTVRSVSDGPSGEFVRRQPTDTHQGSDAKAGSPPVDQP